MPRLHSVSQYHSQPSIKQSPGSTMSPLPLLHLNPRTSPLKTRPATPVHSQSTACQSAKPTRRAPAQPNRAKPKSAPRSASATHPSAPKRTSKSRDDTQLAAPLHPTPSAPALAQPPNQKSAAKRSRKPQEGAASPLAADQPAALLYNLSFPEPHQSVVDSPDRLINPSPTPRTLHAATKRQALSLTDFCDQLTAEVHDQSFEVNPSPCARTSKKKPAHRKSKKAAQRRAPMCLTPSDSEDVLTFGHPIFLSHESPSRSGTPTPVRIVQSPPTLTGPTLVLDDAKLAASPAGAKPCSTLASPSNQTSDSATSSPPRQHVRAKSVASIFDLEKPQLAPKPPGAKDDWDMPPAAPPRGLTWQQTDKKATHPVSANSQLAQKLASNDPSSSPSDSANVKETHSRRQRTALARTSSANTLSRPSVATARTSPSHSSRSDDESALTWQQSILRPLPRQTLLTPRSDQSGPTPQTKSCNKKNAALTGSKAPVKAAGTSRQVGVASAAKPRPSAPPPPPNQRRNSLSSPRPSAPHPVENTPIHEKSRSLALESGENVFAEWKSFATPANAKSAQPIFSNPLPILGAHADHNTPNRRHVKSYTHQPTLFPHTNSAPVSSHIPDTKDMKAMAPSKPRSTSEDLYLGSPVNKLSSPALRAAFMYAGPQFHNSPCPAALPAPKFSFGSP